MFVVRNKKNPNLIKSFAGTKTSGQQGDFDKNEWEEVEIDRDELPSAIEIYKEKPILTGKELTQFFRSLFSELSITERTTLLAPLAVTFNVVEQDTNFTEEEFEEVIVLSKQLILQTGLRTEEQVNQLESLIRSWASTRKFEKKEFKK